MKFACKRYFSSISTENDSSSSFFTSVHQRLTKRIRTNYVKKNTVFTPQQKISLNLVKTVMIRDLHRSRKFTCYFSRKKSFMQHPQFLLHKRNLSEHLRKS